MRHFFFPCANRGASLVHAHVRRKGGKITGPGVYETEFFWKRMHPPRGIWIPHYACAH